LWGVISHTALNFMSMGNVEHFRSLLNLYNFKRNKDHISYSTNSKMIDGISDLKVTQERRLYKGMILQGQYVQMTCKGINWPSLGSLYLWGNVFNHFLSSYSGLNSYTRFEIQDENTGTVMQWPIQVGQQELL